jgi:RNA polymerase sigma-70 factor (ECF subfamily)
VEYLEIIEILKKKDRKSLEILYNVYGRKLISYALNKWFLDEDEAWEIVYQTLETLVMKISEYNFESKIHFDNFIFKVFTNYLRQYYRKHRQHQVDVIYTNLNEYQDVEESENDNKNNMLMQEINQQIFTKYYESEIIEDPKLIIIQEALNQLGEFDKDILLLRAQNYSYDEIAQMLNVENNQLKVRYHRAKNKLQKIILENTSKA